MNRRFLVISILLVIIGSYAITITAAPWTPVPPKATPALTPTKCPPTTSTPKPCPTTATPRPYPTNTIRPNNPLPTNTPRPVSTQLPSSQAAIKITSVDAQKEFITLKNMTDAPVSLQGWYILSEAGNQKCNLSGTISANTTWKVYTQKGDGGDVNCGFSSPVLNNSGGDPTSLYDNNGKLISRVN